MRKNLKSKHKIQENSVSLLAKAHCTKHTVISIEDIEGIVYKKKNLNINFLIWRLRILYFSSIENFCNK